jgi:ribosomal protein L11 methyltransferase
VAAQTWLRLSLPARAPVLEALSTLLVEWGAGGIEEGRGELRAYYPPEQRGLVEERLRVYASDLGEELAWSWEALAEEDWWESWKAYFRPVLVSERLAVCPTWEEWAPPSRAVRVIRVDPGRAFGTGTHETTRLCLKLLDECAAQTDPRALLDVGCGSGILSVAGRLLGIPRVVAFDVDPIAAEATAENARTNRVGDGVAVFCGDLRAVRGRFPLAVANILYQVLLGLAPGLAERVEDGGRLILSGMLACELPSARALYASVGFSAEREAIEGEWGALVLRRGVREPSPGT